MAYDDNFFQQPVFGKLGIQDTADISSLWDLINSDARTTVEPSGNNNSLGHSAVQPLNPQVSVESTQPLNPWVLVENTQPLNSWCSAESIEPLNPWVSVENTQLLDPLVSVENTQPLNPWVSVENTQPLNPWCSAESIQPLNPLVAAESIQPLNQKYSAERIQPIFYSPSSIFQQGFDLEASVPPTQRLVQENDHVIQTFATPQAYNCVSSTSYNLSFFSSDAIPNTNLKPTPPSLPTSTPKSNPNTNPCLLTQRTYSPASHFQSNFDSEAVRSPFSSDQCETLPNTNLYTYSGPHTSIYLNIPPSSSSNLNPIPQSHQNYSINSNPQPSGSSSCGSYPKTKNWKADAFKNRIRCKKYQKKK